MLDQLLIGREKICEWMPTSILNLKIIFKVAIVKFGTLGFFMHLEHGH